MATQLFTFEDLSSKDKAVRTLQRQFQRAGATVASTEINPTVKRTSGITYREILLTFADSQTVTFRVKRTGDIFQVLLNGKVTPIANQDDQTKAIEEVAKRMDAGRSSFQKKLARAQIKVPTGMKTSAPKIEKVQAEKIAALNDALAEAQQQREEVRAEIAKVKEQINSLQETSAEQNAA